MSLEKVVSPVNGVISEITENTITIYISPEDDHTVKSPISGKIVEIKHQNGAWNRRVFSAYEKKLARVTVYIKKINSNQPPLSFWLEVGEGDPSLGEPVYITNRLRITPKEGDDVSQGQSIGEIILGSLSRVRLKGIKHTIRIKKHERVIGGDTPLADIYL